MRDLNWRRVMVALASRGEATVGDLATATGVKAGTVQSLMSQAKYMGAVEKRGFVFASMVTMSDVNDAGRFYDLKRTDTPPQDAATTRGEG